MTGKRLQYLHRRQTKRRNDFGHILNRPIKFKFIRMNTGIGTGGTPEHRCAAVSAEYRRYDSDCRFARLYRPMVLQL